MQSRILNDDMECKSGLESAHVYIHIYSEPIHRIHAEPQELARTQVRMRFTSCRWALVRRGLLHSGYELVYIVVSSGQRDVFSRNGDVAKSYGDGIGETPADCTADQTALQLHIPQYYQPNLPYEQEVLCPRC